MRTKREMIQAVDELFKNRSFRAELADLISLALISGKTADDVDNLLREDLLGYENLGPEGQDDVFDLIVRKIADPSKWR